MALLQLLLRSLVLLVLVLVLILVLWTVPLAVCMPMVMVVISLFHLLLAGKTPHEPTPLCAPAAASTARHRSNS